MRSSLVVSRVGILLALLVSASAAAVDPKRIEVGITTHLGDRQAFVAGDRISFLLSLERDAYVYLFYRDAESSLLQLLPNERMPAHFFSAGLFMPLPDSRQPFQFIVQPPFGEESIYAYASDNGSLSFSGTPLANGLILLEDRLEQIERRIRAQSKKFHGRDELRLTTSPAQNAE